MTQNTSPTEPHHNESKRLAEPNRPASLSLRLGKVAGVEICLDISVAIVFALVVVSLGSGAFARWHPQWSGALIWTTALAAGVLFFASLLAHELSHSLMAKLRGIPVPRITLFVFGGVSEMQEEPDSPKTEFLIAAVGPAVSLLLGLVCGMIGAWVAGPALARVETADDFEQALAALGPVSTLLLWLGPVNLMLGLFNLVPGFPLDGGRLLRAALWRVTGNQLKATWWASTAGRVVAWGLMGWGLFQALGGMFVQGMWLVLIGWFLSNAARMSFRQLLLRQSVGPLRVRDLMQTHFDVVSPDLTVEQLVNQHVLRGSQLAWPVVEDGRYLGIVDFARVRSTHEDERSTQHVSGLMRSPSGHLDPDAGGREALRALAEQDPLPVVRDGQVVGLLHRNDIIRRVTLDELAQAPS
jgi:Zn-dependent protease